LPITAPPVILAPMPRRIASFALLVPDYDKAIAFFTAIGFTCREDTDLGGGKRWIRLAPPGAETEILLARADDDRQQAAIGEQGGGRVWLFLESTDFDSDYKRLANAGATFEEPPRTEPYGRVVVWNDPWGNRWDLIEYSQPDRSGTAP
jgi:predicted enzyme related to lactoylglutathione lyase